MSRFGFCRLPLVVGSRVPLLSWQVTPPPSHCGQLAPRESSQEASAPSQPHPRPGFLSAIAAWSDTAAHCYSGRQPSPPHCDQRACTPPPPPHCDQLSSLGVCQEAAARPRSHQAHAKCTTWPLTLCPCRRGTQWFTCSLHWVAAREPERRSSPDSRRPSPARRRRTPVAATAHTVRLPCSLQGCRRSLPAAQWHSHLYFRRHRHHTAAHTVRLPRSRRGCRRSLLASWMPRRVALRRHQPRSVLPRTPYGSRAHGAVAVGHCPPHGAFAESLVVAAGSPRSTQPRTPYGSHTRCVVAVGPCLPPVRATGPPSSVARYLSTPSRTPYGFHALGVVAVGPCLPPSVPAWSFRTRPCRLPALRSSLSAPAGAPTRPLSSAQRIQESPPDF